MAFRVRKLFEIFEKRAPETIKIGILLIMEIYDVYVVHKHLEMQPVHVLQTCL